MAFYAVGGFMQQRELCSRRHYTANNFMQLGSLCRDFYERCKLM